MEKHKELEEMISSLINNYTEGYNEVNKEYTIKYNLTLTHHHVEVEALKKWVAYLRLERVIHPKDKPDEAESLLVYNQAYKFKDTKERVDPKAPWKVDLYYDLIGRLVAGGLEYGELLTRINNYTKANKGQPISNLVTAETNIEVTDKMPEPLTEDDEKYKEWVKRNKQ